MCLLVVPEGGVKQLCGVLRGKHKKNTALVAQRGVFSRSSLF